MNNRQYQRHAMSDGEIYIYKGFSIQTFQNAEGRWIARMKKADGSLLMVDLPGGTGPREFLDTEPVLGRAIDAIMTAKICIDGGSIK
jgi:hypothetical protein